MILSAPAGAIFIRTSFNLSGQLSPGNTPRAVMVNYEESLICSYLVCWQENPASHLRGQPPGEQGGCNPEECWRYLWKYPTFCCHQHPQYSCQQRTNNVVQTHTWRTKKNNVDSWIKYKKRSIILQRMNMNSPCSQRRIGLRTWIVSWQALPSWP